MLANDYLDSWLGRFRGYTFTGFDVVVELATEGMECLDLRERFEGRYLHISLLLGNYPGNIGLMEGAH
jgi:hypothetical protein